MTKTIRWDGWPHVVSIKKLSRGHLMFILEHAIRFAEAMMADKSLPRLSKRYRLNRDGEEVLRRVTLTFYSASTRTAGTFESAAKALGCDTYHVKEPATHSSAYKGESFLMGTAAYTTAGNIGFLRQCDYLIIRYPEEGHLDEAVGIVDAAVNASGQSNLPLPIINAGDGMTGEHITQTLVDLTVKLYMKRKANPNINPERFLDGSRYLFPGESHRSRVINSLLYSFGKFTPENDIEAWFCCPDGAGPKQDLLLYLHKHGVRYNFFPQTDFHDLIPKATDIYMTRPQTDDPNGNAPKNPVDRSAVQFRAQDLSRLQPGACVQHPLPINENPKDPPAEIDPSLNSLAIAGDPRHVCLIQSHFGEPVRAALLDIIFAGMDEEADKLYGRV